MPFLYDIVFQDGEFFYDTSSSVIEKFWTFFVSFCGIGIPLILFYLGLRLDKKRENKRKIDRQEDNLKYFAILIENILTLSSIQATNCVTVATKISINPIEFPLLEKIVGTDIKRIVNLSNHEDIFHAYISKYGNTTENIKEFRVIFSYLDYLDKIYDQHIQVFETYKEKLGIKYQNYCNITDDLMEHVAILIKDIKNENNGYENNDFWNLINNLIMEYYAKIKKEKLEKNIMYNYDNFTSPIRIALINNSTFA